MVGKTGVYFDGAEGETHFFEFLDAHIRGDLLQAHGEERALHLVGQHVIQAMPSAFITEYAKVIS